MIGRPGSFLRSARLKAGLTQRALSERSGVPQPSIAAIEAGDRDARYLTLERILKACGFELDLVRLPDVPIDREAIRRHLRLTPSERWRAVNQAQRSLTPFPGPRNHEIELADLYALRDELETAERARSSRRRQRRSRAKSHASRSRS